MIEQFHIEYVGKNIYYNQSKGKKYKILIW